MKRRYFISISLIGFVTGAIVVNAITLMANYLWRDEWLLCMPDLVDRVGKVKAAILQTIFGGLFGIACYGGTCVYIIENWSLLRAVAVHYLMILVTYIIVGWVLYWYRFELVSILMVAGGLFFIYMSIWVMMYLAWKQEINEMNELMDEYKKNAEEKG